MAKLHIPLKLATSVFCMRLYTSLHSTQILCYHKGRAVVSLRLWLTRSTEPNSLPMIARLSPDIRYFNPEWSSNQPARTDPCLPGYSLAMLDSICIRWLFLVCIRIYSAEAFMWGRASTMLPLLSELWWAGLRKTRCLATIYLRGFLGVRRSSLM